MVTLSIYAHVLPAGDEHAADVIAGILTEQARQQHVGMTGLSRLTSAVD